MATKENPLYTVVIIQENGDKYELTPVLASLTLSHQKEQLAAQATLTLVNIKYGEHYLHTMLAMRQRVFIYATDGEKSAEVFRGFIWRIQYHSSVDAREIEVQCYDNLVYLQESEDSVFFTSGWSTKDVLSSILNSWGVGMRFQYTSISHGKLALRGTLSDMIVSDVLDEAKKQTGVKYALVMEENTLVVRTAGDNTVFYSLEAGGNVINTYERTSMEGMRTKIVILGESSDNAKTPILATVEGDTDRYGTLQELKDNDSDSTLSAMQAEAQATLDEKGKPGKEYEVKCTDVPWIRKGDRVYIGAGSIDGKMLVVWSIERTITNTEKTMIMILEDL